MTKCNMVSWMGSWDRNRETKEIWINMDSSLLIWARASVHGDISQWDWAEPRAHTVRAIKPPMKAHHITQPFAWGLNRQVGDAHQAPPTPAGESAPWTCYFLKLTQRKSFKELAILPSSHLPYPQPGLGHCFAVPEVSTPTLSALAIQARAGSWQVKVSMNAWEMEDEKHSKCSYYFHEK